MDNGVDLELTATSRSARPNTWVAQRSRRNRTAAMEETGNNPVHQEHLEVGVVRASLLTAWIPSVSVRVGVYRRPL